MHAGRMHYVSLIVEFLRGRPSVVFWAAALTQAALWIVVPSVFYSAPPGDVPMLLAVGREFRLGSYLGPPLAFWFGEVAFRMAGAFGVYVLAQACMVAAYRAVFELGRLIVGTRHAVLAVLLMIGIATFSAPSADFGPAVLALPLWALALLHYWRAAGQRELGYWFLLAVDLGLLLLTSYAGLILLTLLIVFSVFARRAHSSFRHPEPWFAVLLLLFIVFPHIVWLLQSGKPLLDTIRANVLPALSARPALQLFGLIVAVHLGLLLLVWSASGFPRRRHKELAPEIDRMPTRPFARSFIYFFAVAPALVALMIVAAYGRVEPLVRIGPLLLLSGLAVIVLAGDRVPLYRERVVSFAWLGLLIAPPILTALAVTVLPWVFPTDLRVAQPANAMGRFFAESYQRRTGKPLPYVAGDNRTAALVALGSPSRPHVFFTDAPEQSPWATPADIRAQGGLLVWPAPGTSAAPPQEIKADFPGLVAEVPRAFPRRVEGFLPLIRMGWAVVRPQVSQSEGHSLAGQSARR
ncbi:MAG TPA: glycosyltransferase family 39 protein [Pseudolabrys sp.]|nr:glycosyltransferase family 39 protein [Pseudolabrys sp.]